MNIREIRGRNNMQLRKLIKYNPLTNYLRWEYIAFRQRRYVRELQEKEKINVVFFAMQRSLWKYQNLYREISKNNRFNVSIVLSPAQNFAKEQQERDMQELRKFFIEQGIAFCDYDVANPQNAIDVKKELDPDILFYPQHYTPLLNPLHDSSHFYDRLICYYPYALWTTGGSWGYNSGMQNHAWKLFYSTKFNLEDARTFCFNKGKNAYVVGYPSMDDFLQGDYHYEWKIPDEKVKKIIWAPHFSINSGNRIINRACFLWMADTMLNIAQNYKDKLQIVFKPHPRLMTELYDHPDWGKDKTDQFYHLWETMPNTKVETGNYIDLFMTSDAMIHDCGSFSVEYLYSKKPVMFMTNGEKEYRKELNGLGNGALDQHYIGTDTDAIYHFIDDVVLSNNDPKKDQRNKFVNDVLLPPNGKSVVDNTMDVICDGLKGLG